MALARWKKLCVDAVDPGALGPFWGAAAGLEWRPYPPPWQGEGGLYGDDPQQPVIWVNRVPEPKADRIYLDIYTTDLAELLALGSQVVQVDGVDRHRTVLSDPEGGQYCAVLRDDPPPRRLRGVVVDSVDAFSAAHWWAEVLDGRVVDDQRGFASVTQVDRVGYPLYFVPVSEPKTAVNRVHWDLSVPDLAPLLDRGATVMRTPGGDVSWYILADSEGNEFCAFDVVHM